MQGQSSINLILAVVGIGASLIGLVSDESKGNFLIFGFIMVLSIVIGNNTIQIKKIRDEKIEILRNLNIYKELAEIKAELQVLEDKIDVKK